MLDDAISEVSLPRIDKRYLPNQSSASVPLSVVTQYSPEKKIRPIAAERWNIRKKKNEQDEYMSDFYQKYMSKCRQIEQLTNQKSAEIYNSIYCELKWANPPVAAPHIKFILKYCKHVIRHGSSIPFKHEVELGTWNMKVKGLFVEKTILKVKKMYMRLYKLIEKRDLRLNEYQNSLISKSAEMKEQNDNMLRWMMHQNHGKKDKFFTIWQLATSNKIRELQVLLAAPLKMSEYGTDGINARDPDFALTPLIYACRASHLEMVKYLLSVGANPLLKAPDGRSALHYAAAYANRDILLILLGLGMDVEERDDYECTPLDLARQNVNRKTIPTLESWNKLTSMQILPTGSMFNDSFIQDQDDEEDIFGENTANKIIPFEFQATNALDFQHMSPSLKLTTKRLNGYNPYLTNPTRVTTDYMNSQLFSLCSATLEGMSNHLQESSRIHLLSASGSNDIDREGKVNLPDTADIIPRISADQRILGTQDQTPFPTAVGTTEIKKSHEGAPNLVVEDSMQLSNTQQLQVDLIKTLEKFLTEIRLCSKHYSMCITEQFFDEGLKTLKRRWLVAKMLYKELHSPDVDNHLESSTVIDGTSKILAASEESKDMIPDADLGGSNDKFGVEEGGGKGDTESVSNQVADKEEDREGGENGDNDDDDEEEEYISLEKIASDFLKTRTNVTYVDPNESINAKEKYEKEIIPQTLPSSTTKVSQLSDKLFVEDQAFEFYDDPYRVTTLEVEVNKPSQEAEAKANSNPEFILDIMDKFSNYEHVKRLKEYAWRYENKEILDHYTVYSNTTAGNMSAASGRGSGGNSVVSDHSLTLSSWSLTINRNPAFAQLYPSMSSVGQYSMEANPHRYGNYIVRLGYELVEVLLVLKRYTEAYQAMQDCLSFYSDVLITTRILVLFQKCDVLLFGYDHWEDVGEEMSEVVMTTKMEGEDVFHTLDASMIEDQAEDLEQRSYSPLRYSHTFQGSSKVLEHSMHLSSSKLLEPSQQSIEEDHIDPVQSSSNLEGVSSSFVIGEDSAYDADVQQQVPGSMFRSSFEGQDTKEVFLQECIRSAQEAIDLSYVLSRNYLVEGYDVCQALSFISKAMERKRNVNEALRYMDEAAILSRRIRGASVETITLMIEVRYCTQLVYL